jgi:hypothetical protein
VALEEGREFVSLVSIICSADPFGLVFAAEGVDEITSWSGFEILLGWAPVANRAAPQSLAVEECTAAIAEQRCRIIFEEPVAVASL